MKKFKLYFYFRICYWLKSLTKKKKKKKKKREGTKPEYPETTPDDELQKMPHTKSREFMPQPRLEPAVECWWQPRKIHTLTITPLVTPTRCKCDNNDNNNNNNNNNNNSNNNNDDGDGDDKYYHYHYYYLMMMTMMMMMMMMMISYVAGSIKTIIPARWFSDKALP